jgi:hypothetical protein
MVPHIVVTVRYKFNLKLKVKHSDVIAVLVTKRNL